MTFEDLQNEMNRLIGEQVTFRRIAGNSIILYFRGEPGDSTVTSFFIHPTWRYQRGNKIIVGSYDLPWGEEDFKSKVEYEQAFEEMCSLSDDLKGASLIAANVDPASSDLTLKFSDDKIVRNFTNSAFKEGAWEFRIMPKTLCIYVGAVGLTLRQTN